MVYVKEQLVEDRSRTFDGHNPHTTLTFHETANTDPGANAQRHADLQSDVNVRQASWHLQGDDTQIIRSFPPEVQCWHAGDGDGPGNTTSEAYEICVNADGDFNAAVALAVEFGRQWRAQHNRGRDAIRHHGHWSGKHCPSQILDAGLWEAFVAATDPHGKNPPPVIDQQQEAPMSTPRMVSPVRGYTTSPYGRRGSAFHAGHDIGTGGQRRAVYAAFAGTVERVVRGRKHMQPATRGAVLAPGRSGNGVIIRNPDGERQLYGHVNPSVSVGQRVSIGQRIGTVDLSGITTGLHLHFEIWNANGATRNPLIDFRHFGVTPGAALPTGLPKSSGGGSSSSGGSGGIEWPANALRVDGNFGPVSRRAYQRLLAPKSVGNYTGRIDGQHGPMTTRAEQRWLKSRGHYTGRIDGDRGPMTRRALQNLLRARGFYTGRIDGDLGAMTNRAMQSFLNDQRKHYR